MADDSVSYFSQVQGLSGWQTILESFARFVDPPAQSRVLDVGCGPGAFVDILHKNHAVSALGIDLEQGMITIAHQNYSAGFLCGALPYLPFEADTFDVVTAANVIYLLDDPLAGLRESVRVLKPGAEFVMLNPSEQMSQLAARQLADERGLRGFARENFIHWGAVAEANHRFTPVDIEGMFSAVGLTVSAMKLRIGTGLARYVKGHKR